jgi:hypothetical protein
MEKLTLITINGRSVLAWCSCNDEGQPRVSLEQALRAVNKANPQHPIPDGSCLVVGF